MDNGAKEAKMMLESLEILKEQSEQFTQDIYDYVSCLGMTHLLDSMYEFGHKIDEKITEQKEIINAN